jgi:DNA-directed RNA polymerase I subunit RPA1
LIQDHVDAGVDMTSRDTFFTREEYVQLVYNGLRETSSASQIGNGNIEKEIIIGDMGRIRIEPPVLIKPKQLWTGKQIISTILMNLCPTNPSEGLNLISKSKIPAKYWGGSGKEEDRVVFMDGYLVSGILDKSQFGASSNGLVHAVYEIYGAVYAGRLLSILGRLFTAYLQKTGFTCRMDDLLLTKQGDSFRKNLIETNAAMGTLVAETFAENGSITLGLEKVLRNDELMASLDSKMKQKTNLVTSEIISGCIPDKLFKPFPKNNMQVMTVSGAKGSSVNVSQISCLLGQQELEGKRVPTMVSGKTLPSFQAFDPSARAGGYITGRFLTGIKPQEYYFHCMAGREGLIDTAVKTSRSGYLQRCLIKGLEGITVKYDSTVRDSDGSVLQFRYGEDALDVCKQTTLMDFDFCAMNYKALVKRYVKDLVGVDEFSVKKYLKNGGSEVLSEFEPSKYIGAVSSRFSEKLSKFMDENENQLLRVEKQKRGSWSQEQIKKSKFKMLMDLKYMHSLVEPGESVGLLAAQSIGEPSTQMTLNTFHFAGFGAKNVTLGIPRLREIIMTASSHIKTPLMTLPLLDNVTLKQKEDLCGEISQFTLDQIMTGVKVVETLIPKSLLPRRKMLKVRLEFWDSKDYKKQFGISRNELKVLLEKKLFVPLEKAITKILKGLQRKQDDISVGTSKKPSKEVNEDDEVVVNQNENESESDPESDEEGDGGTEVTKTRSKKQQQSSYDDDDDEVMESSDEEEEQEEKVLVEEQVQDTKYISGFSFDSKGKYCELTINVF